MGNKYDLKMFYYNKVNDTFFLSWFQSQRFAVALSVLWVSVQGVYVLGGKCMWVSVQGLVSGRYISGYFLVID